MREGRTKKLRFTGELWQYPGHAGWHFVTLGKSLSKRIAAYIKGDSAPWGSVKVVVQVKKFQWETSIFPDTKIGSYLLPVKKQARDKLCVVKGSTLRGSLTIRRELGIWSR